MESATYEMSAIDKNSPSMEQQVANEKYFAAIDDFCCINGSVWTPSDIDLDIESVKKQENWCISRNMYFVCHQLLRVVSCSQ